MTASAVRRDRLRAAARTAGLEAVLVSRLVNVRYLTGFTGSNAALLVPADADRPEVLCTDGRYTVQAGEQAPDVELLIERNSAVALAERAAKDGYRTLGIETHDVTVDLRATLAEAAGGELVRVKRAVEQLRAVKDDGEVALLREACAAADRALADLVEAGGLRAGPDGAGGGPRARRADARPRRRRGRASRRSSPPGPTRRSRTTGRPSASWPPATSSSSTSAPRSAATTRT